MPKAYDAVLEAVGAGDLAPDEAATIAGLLEGKRKAIETTELADEMKALKEYMEERPWLPLD